MLPMCWYDCTNRRIVACVESASATGIVDTYCDDDQVEGTIFNDQAVPCHDAVINVLVTLHLFCNMEMSAAAS